ncbi:MAG: hypothetical protein AAB278_06540, partial [Pseudomonadota bacterium]
LNASVVNGYTPVNADALPFLTMGGTSTGTFASINLPAGFSAGYALAAGEAARLIYAGGAGGTIVFTNTAGGLDWSVAGNWSGGILPGIFDTALISAGHLVNHSTGNHSIAGLTVNASNSLDVSGGSLTVSGATNVGGVLMVSGGTLTLNGTSTLSTLNLTGNSQLNGSGAVTVSLMNWIGGTVSGSGALTVNGTLSLPNSATARVLSGRTFDHFGNAVLNSTGMGLEIINGGVFNNRLGAVFEIRNTAGIGNSGSTSGAGAFNNFGTLSRTTNAGVTLIWPNNTSDALNFNNTGTVSVTAGGLKFMTAGTHTGSFNVATGASLEFASTQSLNAASINGLGALSISGAINANNAGAVNVGSFTMTAGGSWNQISVAPGSFYASDFNVVNGTFIRALGGDGSTATPYQLTDIYGVQGIGSVGMLGNSYVLTKNIDASVTPGWNGGAGFSP